MKKYRATLLASTLILCSAAASADEYTDLLDILKAKGSLSSSEYGALMAKHTHNMRGTKGHRGQTTQLYASPEEESSSTAAARQAAIDAAASAAAAQAALRQGETMMTQMQNDPAIVHAEPYKLGSGVTIRVGAVDLNFSAIVNGFYTYSSADHATPSTAIGGGLADASGFDSSAIRNGLLPGAFIASASTTQAGIDVSAVFGMYPGLNSASVGLLNANNGGTATALGTSGVDFRKTYMTFGTKELGTVKIGRDIGVFGSDAILNDATLLSVGSSGGNADPANTSLGRIGVGYIYTDFMPQITYISPIFAGLQATVGMFQPLNEFDFSGYSGTATAHNVPLFEGKVTYDYKNSMFAAHLWAGAMTQPQQDIQGSLDVTPGGSKDTVAGEVGAKLTVGPFAATGYYYRAKGVGSTGKFFDGIAPNGELRDSEGFYAQGAYNITPKLKLVGSYGESSLYQAPGEYDPQLFRRNASEIGAGYFTLTDWVTLVAEYAHETATSHGTNQAHSNAFTAGAILFY